MPYEHTYRIGSPVGNIQTTIGLFGLSKAVIIVCPKVFKDGNYGVQRTHPEPPASSARNGAQESRKVYDFTISSGGKGSCPLKLWLTSLDPAMSRPSSEPPKALEQERLQNFQKLCQLEEEALVPNQQEMECRICYLKVEPGKGVLLRECLHSFCKACLRQVVNCSQDPQVSCPFRDDFYACTSHLQDREIRALVTQGEYERFLQRRLAVAESRAQNSYHCRTADCLGWCVYEDDVNEFRCPICWALNCLVCKAIHEGMNCKQYQDKLKSQAHNDTAARETNNMLKTLVQLGEAMHCPACRIVVQKKGGCDWIRCPVCQTEICWVTKGPRWGPGGYGDISGGCQCNVNGERCHQLCQNCH